MQTLRVVATLRTINNPPFLRLQLVLEPAWSFSLMLDRVTPQYAGLQSMLCPIVINPSQHATSRWGLELTAARALSPPSNATRPPRPRADIFLKNKSLGLATRFSQFIKLLSSRSWPPSFPLVVMWGCRLTAAFIINMLRFFCLFCFFSGSCCHVPYHCVPWADEGKLL